MTAYDPRFRELGLPHSLPGGRWSLFCHQRQAVPEIARAAEVQLEAFDQQGQGRRWMTFICL